MGQTTSSVKRNLLVIALAFAGLFALLIGPLNRAWGEGAFVADRTIDVHVKTLRKKFAAYDFIETVRGVGYRAKELGGDNT